MSQSVSRVSRHSCVVEWIASHSSLKGQSKTCVDQTFSKGFIRPCLVCEIVSMTNRFVLCNGSLSSFCNVSTTLALIAVVPTVEKHVRDCLWGVTWDAAGTVNEVDSLAERWRAWYTKAQTMKNCVVLTAKFRWWSKSQFWIQPASTPTNETNISWANHVLYVIHGIVNSILYHCFSMFASSLAQRCPALAGL